MRVAFLVAKRMTGKKGGLMEDMISRKKAINELCRMLRDCFGADDEELDAVTVTLNELPSAQPEIVQCKDCNHWSRESICDGFCSEDCMRHDEDFYCGYAERRTDET